MNGSVAGSGFRLDGRRAVVAGAAGGLGREIVARLCAEGAQVWAVGRTAATLEALASQVVGAEALVCDIGDAAACERAFARVAREGGLDILVNAVGGRDRRPIEALDAADLRAMLEINLVVAYDLARRAAALMRAQRRGGRIVNLTSIAGPIARGGDAAYTAAKGGLEALTRALAAELGGDAITVNAVAPGFFSTSSNAAMVADPAVGAWLRGRTSLGRWGEPHEIAGAVGFLASPAASFVTGQTLCVDGGHVSHF